MFKYQVKKFHVFIEMHTYANRTILKHSVFVYSFCRLLIYDINNINKELDIFYYHVLNSNVFYYKNTKS